MYYAPEVIFDSLGPVWNRLTPENKVEQESYMSLGCEFWDVVG